MMPICQSASLRVYSTIHFRYIGTCAIIFYYVDQIADGMTLQVKVVNLLLETGGGAHREGGAAW